MPQIVSRNTTCWGPRVERGVGPGLQQAGRSAPGSFLKPERPRKIFT